MDSWAIWQRRIWSLEWDLRWGVRENWFRAEAEPVRCSGSMLNNQTGIVTGDEQISDTHEHTHASGHTHRVWYESQKRFDIFWGWEKKHRWVFPLCSCSSLGKKKTDATKGLLFQDIFKEETVGGCWRRNAVLPLPKYGGNIHLEPIAIFQQNPLSASNSFLGQGSQKFKQSQWIIWDSKNTNKVQDGP